jgi:hypothetical protein
LRHLRLGSPRLAEVQAAVHELPFDREELRRPLTPNAAEATTPAADFTTAAWTIAS